MSTQQDINAFRTQRLANTHDPLALMANTQTPFHPDQSSLITYLHHPQPNNNFVPQPSFNANYMQQPTQNPKDILDPTTAIDMALVLMAKAFTLNDTTPTNNNQISSSNPSNMEIAQPGMNMDQDRHILMVEDNVGNQFKLNVVQNVRNQYGIGNVVIARAEANGNGINGNQIRCYNCQGVDHYASNYTVKTRKRDAAYLQKQIQIAQKEEAGIQLAFEEFDFMAATASTSGTQSDKAPVYNSDGSAENDSNVISAVSSVEQGGGTVKHHSATVKETRAYHESLFHNLAAEVEKVNSVNRKMKETNAKLTTELARYKNQEKCFEISQEKYDKLERCYQKSVYQEQCLTKKINALHLSSGKQITALNEEISILNNQFSKERSTISYLQEEKKRLNSDFKIREDELLDKQIQLENKIKELDNILVKTEAAKFVQDFKSLAKEADESLAKHKALELEIERLLRAFVSQDIMSIVQNPSVVDKSNLQTELERTKERFENSYNDMQQKIKRLQAQLGDHKGKSKDTSCVSDTLDPLPRKLENENVELEFQLRAQLFDKVSEQKDTTKGTSVNTQFCKQSILGKPPSSSGSKLYSVTPFPKSKGLSKIDESHALSKPVTSNWVDNFVPNKHVKASVRTKLITVSQPHVITKNEINSKTNGFSPKDVKSTTRTRRPQPRNNPKNDKVPSKSKISWLSNNLEIIEENHRNLQSSSNQKHMSSECNNIKLAI
ncbi:hypothetical protein Tco_0368952 [Tanacetum coccineum]